MHLIFSQLRLRVDSYSRIRQLRNNALEPQLARLFEKLRAIAFDVIAVTQHAGFTQRLHQFRQHSLPLDATASA